MNNNMIKLNLGCGDKKIYGFINIDIRPEVNPDTIDNIATLSTFTNDSVDLVYSCHNLEHFNKHEYLNVLRRWYDILKPGGILRLAVPDIGEICKHYVYHQDLTTIRTFFWGGQKDKFDYHFWGWDFDTLEADLIYIGFINIHRYNWMSTEHYYIDDYSQAYLPHMDKINGKLFSLNVEGTK